MFTPPCTPARNSGHVVSGLRLSRRRPVITLDENVQPTSLSGGDVVRVSRSSISPYKGMFDGSGGDCIWTDFFLLGSFESLLASSPTKQGAAVDVQMEADGLVFGMCHSQFMSIISADF